MLFLRDMAIIQTRTQACRPRWAARRPLAFQTPVSINQTNSTRAETFRNFFRKFTFFHTTKYTVSIETDAIFFFVAPSNFRLKIDYNDIFPGAKHSRKKMHSIPPENRKISKALRQIIKKVQTPCRVIHFFKLIFNNFRSE